MALRQAKLLFKVLILSGACEDRFQSGEFFENTLEDSGSLYTLVKCCVPQAMTGDALGNTGTSRRFAQSLRWKLRDQSLVSGYCLYCFSQYPQQIQGLIDSMQGRQYLGQTLACNTVE